ncbi:MAG: hypothetical protein WBQ82_09450, partial [Methyloceanibacter sp.]
CLTAVLCVKLGNYYGTSWAAQEPADEVIRGLSRDRWLYYFNERFDQDRIILSKLQSDNPLSNWMTVVGQLQLDPAQIKHREARMLLTATNSKNKPKVQSIAQRMFEASVE